MSDTDFEIWFGSYEHSRHTNCMAAYRAGQKSRQAQWISVDDRLPEDLQKVLYYFELTGVTAGKYDLGSNSFYSNKGWLCGDVTHWQPEPEPPTKQGDL